MIIAEPLENFGALTSEDIRILEAYKKRVSTYSREQLERSKQALLRLIKDFERQLEKQKGTPWERSTRRSLELSKAQLKIVEEALGKKPITYKPSVIHKPVTTEEEKEEKEERLKKLYEETRKKLEEAKRKAEEIRKRAAEEEAKRRAELEKLKREIERKKAEIKKMKKPVTPAPITPTAVTPKAPLTAKTIVPTKATLLEKLKTPEGLALALLIGYLIYKNLK